ncbi:Sodium transporter HKT1 [Morella rubra]|uniref:Sodium transporter HKT1 n=1 Tax=Morella rubra TaxID=262757 RepID=A0A6A1W5H4_9ROSI|nr:Sodium transporter HKT1 [Morella rubra]
MEKFASFGRKLEHFCRKFVYIGKKLAFFCKYSCRKLSCFNQFCQRLIWLLFRFVVVHVNPVWIQLCYFVVVSLVGYLALKLSKVRTSSFEPQDLDVFFTSVSATTVSSMSTVEMQVFSNTQLIIMTILMFVGGEIFLSMLGLQLARFRFPENLHQGTDNRDSACRTINVNHTSTIYCSFESKIELGLATRPQLEQESLEIEKLETNVENGVKSSDNDALRYHSIRSLCYVVLGYLLIIHVVGSGIVYLYISLVPSASQALNSRGLKIQTFSVFTVVSSFTNCGFIPTNENMMVFKKNSGLLLLLMPQILMGNTLYPPCLLLVIWVLNKITKRAEFDFMLRNYRDMGYRHLLSGTHAVLLAATVFGFTLIQFILFCSMEWNSEAMDGLSLYQKLVGSLFQTVNSRYAGESVFDLSSISPAILVLFVVVM